MNMKKKYDIPRMETVQSDFKHTYMEWISQGPDASQFDTKKRSDEPKNENPSDYGSLW